MTTKQVSVEQLFNIKIGSAATIEVGESSTVLDQNYYFDPIVLRKMILWHRGVPGFQNFGIVGNAGIGKTSCLKEFSARMGKEFRSISVSGDTRFESLFGRREIRNGNTEYVETGLAEMARRGGVFCANEFFRMDAGEAMRFVDFMDVAGTLTNPETGELIPIHPNFRYCFTGNSGGFGDLSGAYAGERRGSFALRDRCTIITLPALPEEEEIKIIIGNTPSLKEYPEIVTSIVKTAKAVREAFVGRGGGICVDISPRGLVRWSNLFFAYWTLNNGPSGELIKEPLIESLMDACLAGAPQDDIETVLELTKTWINASSLNMS